MKKKRPDFAEEKDVSEVEQELLDYMNEDHSGGKKKKKRFARWTKKQKLIAGS